MSGLVPVNILSLYPQAVPDAIFRLGDNRSIMKTLMMQSVENFAGVERFGLMKSTLRGLIEWVADFMPWIPDWVFAIAAFVGIIFAGLALQSLINRILKRRPAEWRPFVKHAWKRTRGLMRFMLVLFALSVILPLLHPPHDLRDDIRRVFLALAVIQLGWIIGVIVNIAMDRYTFGLRTDVADNLHARRAATQMRIVRQAVNVMIGTLTVGFALMSFDSVRQFGISLFASAGVAGIVAGLAARPLFENLIAGLQLAFTQPLRLGDAVVINNEFGTVEEIGNVYIVIKLWDLRRQIVPLSYLFTNPFVNWTRSSSSIVGSVMFVFDYTMDVDVLRAEAERVVKASGLWDEKVFKVQVVDAAENGMKVRVLVSASDSGRSSDLNALLRENLIAHVRDKYPMSLPRTRQEPIATAKDASLPQA
ncbi:MAG: mechanosensitive ion channel family protein [Rhizomicrobium sp.]